MSTDPRTITLSALALATLLAAGCSTTDADPADPDAAPAGDTEESAQADSVSVTDPWIKAATADDGMTALFGDLTNEGDAEVRVVAASTEIADTVELHEVTEGEDGNSSMREIEDGFPVEAGDERPLEPGADHVMLMDLTEDLEPGMEVTVVLEFEDGSTAEVTAPVKDFEGANEEYDSDHDHHDHHDDHDDHDEDADDEDADDEDEDHH
ncbi:copper chaperone PCu(A)C [Spiractinospora alimapuensis]|uniref:copper chaperone PCu(A)C n=1 Tax=Spiractinospora alimapuensis TaxID=2820884 RepID=UPI001F45164E|nr:copper chaperone PCu(A)C [Spiractinospora alimapuensis]QVQ50810.1 copper chaperone PCu(A)C [Spiractinospora alimapuensis]